MAAGTGAKLVRGRRGTSGVRRTGRRRWLLGFRAFLGPFLESLAIRPLLASLGHPLGHRPAVFFGVLLLVQVRLGVHSASLKGLKGASRMKRRRFYTPSLIRPH